MVALSLIFGDRFWTVRTFGYIRDIALLIAVIPLPIALWRRRRRSVVLQLLCAISLLWVPASTSEVIRPVPSGSMEITVLTLNLGDGLAGAPVLIPFLKSSGVDLIGLQEVTTETGAAIESNLATAYPFRVVRGLGIPGKALLSKYPITDYRWLESNPDRPDLMAKVNIDGMMTTVIVAHPPPPHLTTSGIVSRPGGDVQFTARIETIAETQGPLLVLGDLNITQYHDRYDELVLHGLVDVFAEVGSGAGHTTPARLPILNDVNGTLGGAKFLPLLRIDYIWATSHWYPLESWVADDVGSDHLPVVARMALCCTPQLSSPQDGTEAVSPASRNIAITRNRSNSVTNRLARKKKNTILLIRISLC